MKQKKAIEMGFNWLFAIIAGGFILFIAIYTAGTLINVFQKEQGTVTSKRFISNFDPLATGFAAGEGNNGITFNKNSRFYFECDELLNPPFGRETISFSEQTFGKKWSDRSDQVPIKDKYIFSEDALEGKKFFMISFPFSMPFTIAEVIIISSSSYCFYDAPYKIRENVEDLSMGNVVFPNLSSEKCTGVKVCFSGGSKCDARVSLGGSYVEKDGEKMYYYDNLLYGAIFSSPEIYECNVKRLMNKMYELGQVYNQKIKIIERTGCEAKIGLKLNAITSSAKNITNSQALIFLGNQADEINIINDEAGGCRLY
ncbi:MAG: hypothetical protein Q8N99_06025 [Nanoarchaeota archaeon]|nr:hypothetical protein [Nanoarchaeota archaeon]